MIANHGKTVQARVSWKRLSSAMFAKVAGKETMFLDLLTDMLQTGQ